MSVYELGFAAHDGDVQKVVGLLDNKVDINGISRKLYGKAALHWAAEYGHDEVVKVLLERKADINIKNSDQETSLIHATQNGNVPAARLLIEGNADINCRNALYGLTALHYGCERGYVEIVEMLVSLNADLDIQSTKHSLGCPEGSTALHCACERGNSKIIDILIKSNANTNIQTKSGELAIDFVKNEEIKKKLQKAAHKYILEILESECPDIIPEICSIIACYVC